MKVTQAITRFLQARLESHPGRDLLERYLKTGGASALETQVNVAAGNGEPVEGKRTTWTDGVNSWWNVRVPKNANDQPEWDDYELRFPLEEHAEGIGSTGWDWAARRSRWFGFDFDSITGHAKGVGISAAELDRVCEAAQAIPYVEVRRSTGGKGFHLYVYFDDEGVPTANHTEHAALARCVLGMMSSEASFDFASQIDACGHVMWVWHRKMTQANQGLALVKPASRTLTVHDLPANWRDHIEVVTRRRSKIRVNGVSDKDTDPFEALASARRIIPLDDKHRAIIQALTEANHSTLWVPDHHLLQTHTKALQNLMDDAETRNKLGLIGYFKTSSAGRDPGTPNCFLFPLLHGGWKVYRFSPGINEAETWTQDGNGWTTCYYNRLPDFETACKAHGGVKDPDSGAFVFNTALRAISAADALGQKIDIEDHLRTREASLKVSKDGKLAIYIKRDKDEDPEKMEGWLAKKDKWVREYDKKLESNPSDELGFNDYDNALRSLLTPNGESAGWVVSVEGGCWSKQPLSHVKMMLQNSGMGKPEAEAIMGGAVKRSWKLVNLPFHDEYPGGRQWNMDAAQFRYKPAELADDEVPYHPHWDLIYKHVGSDLDAAIREAPWAERMGIKTGAQYLVLWIACMFRDPFEPLPYLFMYGSENCGKSIFHEALELLITKGIVKADRTLTSGNEFNGELASAILCVVEEKNVAASPTAHARIKEWVTCRNLSIRKMRTDSYTQPNTTHWVQCANRQDHCPVFPNDTRITVINVPDLLPEQEIPKKKLLEKLKEEAPHFMHTLMNTELPPVEGRLRLPVVETANKLRSEEFSRDELEQFIDECCHYAPGEAISFKDFYDKFYEWLPADQRAQWNRIRCARSLPAKYPSWKGTDNKKFIGNLSFEEAKNKDANPIVVVNGRMLREEVK
jgi:hypothetical protein